MNNDAPLKKSIPNYLVAAIFTTIFWWHEKNFTISYFIAGIKVNVQTYNTKPKYNNF